MSLSAPAPVSTPPVDRVMISWICVATNDGHPLHLDHEFAKQSGFKDVVVPGHILIGWMGQYLEHWCGDPMKIRTWKIRFTAPVWPGDQFTLMGEIEREQDGVACVKVTATSQDGKVCGVAAAELTTPGAN